MNFSFTFGGTPASLNFVFYVVNSGKLFVYGERSGYHSDPSISCVSCHSKFPRRIHNASLNGDLVISLTGHSMCGSVSGVPKAVVGLLTTTALALFPLPTTKTSAVRPIP